MPVNNLAGSSPAATYNQLLHCGTTSLNSGLSMYTGDGTRLPLSVANDGLLLFTNNGQPTVFISPQSIDLANSATTDTWTTIDFHASPGTDWNARISRDAGLNGSLSFGNTGSADIIFYTYTINGAVYNNKLVIQQGGAVVPGGNGTQSLGTTLNRWSQLFAATSTISTSDARQKQQIRPLSEAETAVAVALKPMLRAFKFNDAVATKGDKARIHIGIIAQDVVAAFAAEGLDAADYALLCYDEWEAKPETLDKDGKVMQPAIAAGNAYGIRYEQLLAFMLAAL